MRKSVHVARAFLMLCAFLAASCSTPLTGLPESTLDKATAQKILESMGYADVTVGAIVQGATHSGLGGVVGGATGTALVLGVGVRAGKSQKLEYTLMRDAEVGWFYSEFIDDPQTPGSSVLRMWDKESYREVRPSPKATPKL